LPAHHQHIAIEPRAVELSERFFIKLADINAFSDSAYLRCIAMNLQHLEILHGLSGEILPPARPSRAGSTQCVLGICRKTLKQEGDFTNARAIDHSPGRR
jgi:hypothetical protein